MWNASTYSQDQQISASVQVATLLMDAMNRPHWLLNLDNNSDAVRDILSFLKRASILQESTDGGKTIIHRLQGQIYRETYMSNQEKFSEARRHATTLLNEIDVDRLENFEQQPQETHNLVEQIGTGHISRPLSPIILRSRFVALLATTLRNATDLGMLQLALTLTHTVAQVDNTHGSDHPYPLISYSNLAYAYQTAGRLDKTITLYQQNLDSCTQSLGPNHPSTLTSRNNLASAYQAAGRLHEAITLYEQNLKDSTRILGPDHPHTLISRNNLASAYRAAGRTEEAEALFETPSGSEDEQNGTEEDSDQEAGD